MSHSIDRTGRIFISSTCSDLIDLRAVLERSLREAALTPVLSDRPTSEFANPGDRSAIETCMVNLRQCERCVTVLSRRYGAPMPDAPYGGLSATHLEYREARRAEIPVLFYVRDRLQAEFELWTRHGSTSAQDSIDEDRGRLFEFIREHAQHHDGGRPGWMWAFQSAEDLSQRVLSDLGGVARAAKIRMLSLQGLLPQLQIRFDHADERGHLIELTNYGRVPALRLTIVDTQDNPVLTNVSLMPGGSLLARLRVDSSLWNYNDGHAPVVQVFYDAESGDRVCDCFAVLVPTDAPRYLHAGRRFIGRSIRLSTPDLKFENGRARTPMAPLNAAHDQRLQ
jgi:hypothetical protein